MDTLVTIKNMKKWIGYIIMLKCSLLMPVCLTVAVSCGGGGGGGGDVASSTSDSALPSVNSTGPTHGAIDVAVVPSITATFNKAMDSGTITTDTFSLDNGATGAVSYNSGTKTAILIPDNPLLNFTTYTATLTGELKDTDGNSLTSYSWSFTTEPAEDTTPPTVSFTEPDNGATEVGIDEDGSVTVTVTVTFSEAMNEATITPTTFLIMKKSDSSSINGQVKYNSTNHRATFIPANNLYYRETYTVTITTEVTDTASNAMAQEYTWDFKTRGPVPPAPP